MTGSYSNSAKKNVVRQSARIWTGLLLVFLLTGMLTAAGASETTGAAAGDGSVETSGQEEIQTNQEEGTSLEDEDPQEDVPAEDLELDHVSVNSAATVFAPPQKKRFRISASDPQVLSLAKKQTPGNGKLVTSKGKTFWRFKNGKRLKNSWVWYHGKAYRMNSKGYAMTGMHSYKGFHYCFDSAGRLIVKKLFRYKQKTYYACKTGALVTGAWVKIRGAFHYFRNNASMAVNTKIDGLRLDSRGRIDSDKGAKPVRTGVFKPDGKKQMLIIVGASRVRQMAQAVTTDRNVIYIAHPGKGLDWFKNRAFRKLRRYLKKYPKSKVVIQLGNNDIKKNTPDGRIDDYIQTYKSLISKWPKAKFYFMDILPSADESNQKKVEASIQFNRMIALTFPGQYIGGRDYMLNNGFRCSYNLSHYSDNTSRDIYNFILRKIR